MNTTAITARYDRSADVLYVTTDRNAPAKAKVDGDGLIWRYAMSTGEPVGVTIMDYKSFWVDHLAEIVSSVAKVFHVSASQASAAIRSSTR